MGQYPTLSSPPIKEAVIDIRIIPPDEFDVNVIKSLVDQLVNEYPKAETSMKSDVKFGFNKGRQLVEADNVETIGYRMWSKDQTQVVVMTSEGFTISQLAPYTGWDKFEAASKRLWNEYLNVVKPSSITRLAVRYINKLDMKQTQVDLADVLTAPPALPGDLESNLENFLNRVVIRDSKSDIRAIVTQTPSESIESKYPSIILDIDVFLLNGDGIDGSEIWTIINKLRLFKNDIFFKSITDNHMEAYK